jgi:hypothetical protein
MIIQLIVGVVGIFIVGLTAVILHSAWCFCGLVGVVAIVFIIGKNGLEEVEVKEEVKIFSDPAEPGSDQSESMMWVGGGKE